MENVKNLTQESENTQNAQATEKAASNGKNTARMEERRQKRAQLSQLCKDLENAASLTGQPLDSPNKMLKAYYFKQGHKELNTFDQWKKKGFRVMKGAKALLLWSKPIDRRTEEQKKLDEEMAAQGMVSFEGPGEFFGYVCLFSNLQVEPIQ